MNLIDRDALIAYCDKNWIPLNVDAVNAQPTIDPVRRGRWVKAERDGCWSYSEAYKQCSECGKVTFLAEKMNYCPNCGALMREEGEEG